MNPTSDHAHLADGDHEPDNEFDDLTEARFEAFLHDAIEGYADIREAPNTTIETFANAGILTSDRGLVVRIGGAEFQITIMRSR